MMRLRQAPARMRSVDTNVLVRYLTDDDPKQAAAVERFFDECRRNRDSVFIPGLVLCELVWVLERSCGFAKVNIANALQGLLETSLFRIEQEPLVRRVLDRYRTGKGNFGDYLIREISRHAGCRDTVSFDRALKNAPGFTIL